MHASIMLLQVFVFIFQVSQFGCTAFALLFDDIEPEISETDKEVYQSFAHAQVAVANEIYEHLYHPKFIFCPTGKINDNKLFLILNLVIVSFILFIINFKCFLHNKGKMRIE